MPKNPPQYELRYVPGDGLQQSIGVGTLDEIVALICTELDHNDVSIRELEVWKRTPISREIRARIRAQRKKGP